MSVVTGIGLSTALGNTAPETWAALVSGRVINNHSHVPNLDSLGQPRVNALACRVANEAIANAGWSSDDVNSAALVLGTSKGPVDAWIESLGRQTPAGDRSLILGIGDTAFAVAGGLQLKGARLSVSAACASGLVALIRGTMMIRSGEASRVLVVAAESSLHPLFIASFDRLGVLAPVGYGCRPFDKSRSGFVISEAAAAVCLESAAPDSRGFGGSVLDFGELSRVADARVRRAHQAGPASVSLHPRPILPGRISVESYALGADATHLTRGDPAGSTLSRILCRVADDRPVDLIHAHGTGTIFNDPIELEAIESSVVAHDIFPSVYSHKGSLGHSLGAAGLVAVAINCLCHTHGIVPPNVHTRDALPAARLDISPQVKHREIKRSLAMAAGFGGAVAAVTLSST